MSLEHIQGRPFTQACDIYAYGVVMWEIMSRKVPWEGSNQMQVGFAVVTEGKRPPLDAVHSCYPTECVELMQECWATDAAARPTFVEIMERISSISGSSVSA